MQTETRKPAKSKASEHGRKETSQSIAEQTKAFLRAGGQVTRIKVGVSGQPIFASKAR